MKNTADTTATPLMLGMISRTDDGWLDMMAQYRGSRDPLTIGYLVRKVLRMSDTINHTDGSFLFDRTDWAQIGAYVLRLEQEQLNGKITAELIVLRSQDKGLRPVIDEELNRRGVLPMEYLPALSHVV